MRAWVLASLLLLPLAAWGADTGTSAAIDAVEPAKGLTAAALTQPVFKGREGEHPVQVAISYLGEHVYDESGLFNYQRLQINQLAFGPERKQAHLTLQTQGLQDPLKTSERFDMQLTYVGKMWQIVSVRQDWKCKRGGWTQRPCAKP